MNLTTNRTFISLENALQLREANLLVEESHRVRPRYFDGKFLAARDLTRDQAYFLARQSGFARALGSGVVDGLGVRAGAVASDLEVDAGFGYTSAGELVQLSRPVRVSLAQLFKLQTLAAQLGTLRQARPPLRNRTGVFVLGLRALEFSANPVAAYPTTLDGPRQVEEGDIVEASALTLTHWVDASVDSLDAQRGSLARDAFVTMSLPALPAELLPLAIVAIAGDNIRWVDVHLVRRAAGQAHSDVLGFGFAPRLQREAHLAQYTQHLASVMSRANVGRPNASQYFGALPAAGPLPAAALNAQDFSQSWFPPGVNAELMLVPEDEIPALVEESLLLPPIDLSLSPAMQESTAVAILVPVPREALARQAARLQQQLQRTIAAPALRLSAKRLPLDTIRLLASTRLKLPALSPAPAVDPVDAVWAELLSAQATLWYTRRRNLSLRPEIEGTMVAVVAADDAKLEDVVRSRFDPASLLRVEAVMASANVASRAELSKLLASPKLASPLLAEATLAALEEKGSISSADVAEVAEKVTAPGVGEGLARLVEARPELRTDPALAAKLASNNRLLELDRTLGQANSFEVARLSSEINLATRGRGINLARVLPPKP